ncbi:MAG: cell division protein ZapA [bacterium]|jgi:cell division protein ZapA|nr:cell division protein ZapA [candidate division TA06 bacterium]MDO9067764.1 cell division protein ZapA [Deltaproteobacteria bacterium]MDO9391797.1 cell division protein ZapA [bacterium]MDP2808155.1 cell division protein ZapA [bacterium]
MTVSKNGIKVEIFGTEYRIKGDANGDYIKQVAGLVDERMRQIAEASMTGSVAKIAILAAVNIADELLKERLARESAMDKLSERLKQAEENGQE